MSTIDEPPVKRPVGRPHSKRTDDEKRGANRKAVREYFQRKRDPILMEAWKQAKKDKLTAKFLLNFNNIKK